MSLTGIGKPLNPASFAKANYAETSPALYRALEGRTVSEYL
jgi:hypothetical protein